MPLLEGWGMSEGAPFCLNPSGPRAQAPVGRQSGPETEIQIVDLETGDRCCRSASAARCACAGRRSCRTIATARGDRDSLRDGWMYTGDIGYVDDDGFLFLVDRKKDMVIVGALPHPWAPLLVRTRSGEARARQRGLALERHRHRDRTAGAVPS